MKGGGRKVTVTVPRLCPHRVPEGSFCKSCASALPGAHAGVSREATVTQLLSREDAEEYTQALGQVVAGGYRQIALAARLGVPEALGLTVEQWVAERLGGYVRLSIPDRRAAVAELTAEGMSTRDIGEVLGVGKDTARRDLAGANAPPEQIDAPSEAASIDTAGANAPDGVSPAEKDRARKVRGTARRESKRAEDATAPPLDVVLHHGSFANHAGALPDGSISLLLTDPPYGANYQSGFRWASPQHEVIVGDATPEQATAVLDRALRTLEPKLAWNSHLLVFCRWPEEPQFREVIERHGWKLRGSLIWVKNEPGMGDLEHSFGPAHERILHGTRGDARMRHRESDTLECPRVVSDRHPTEKPVGLLERLILATANPRDLVADPFAGVASTLVAAKSTGRRGWGCEIDEAYAAEGQSRLASV